MWIILLDHSGSMGDPFTGKQVFAGRSKESTAAIKLDAAKQALLEHLLGLGSPGKIALFAFTSTASLVFEGMSNDLTAIQQVLDGLSPDDGTDIAVALQETTAYVRTLQEEFVLRVLVITDGLSDRDTAAMEARQLVAQGAIIDLILIDPTDQGEVVARAVASNGSVTGVHSARELSDTVAIAREVERRQTEEAARLIRAYKEEQAAVTEKVRPEERLTFTAGYPGAVSPETWYPLLVYLHVAGQKEMVEKLLLQRSTALGLEPSISSTKATASLRRETRLRFTPRLENCTFNPPTQEIIWYEDIQEVAFRLRAEADGAGHTRLGSVEIHAGPLLIAQLPLSITLRGEHAGEEPTAPTVATTQIFNCIFVSYAHVDTPLIEACLAAYRALGIVVYRDSDSLRSGDLWKRMLYTFIFQSDLFQLYWSQEASQSQYVRDEWEYALSLRNLKGEHFIRPLYWEEPHPKIPDELAYLHFARLDLEALSHLVGHPITLTEPASSQQTALISQSGSAPISTTVVPLMPGTTERVITQAREDVASAILFLEETTGLRYYPVPTLLVDRYAVTSVREHLTVDLVAGDAGQKTRAFALVDVLSSICLDFHTHSFFPHKKNMTQGDMDGIFGKGRLLSEAAFDLVRRTCEASVNGWVKTYFEPEQSDWPRNDWQRTREDLLRHNLGAFQPNLDFAGFISTFLSIVSELLQVGLQQLGPFMHESGYTIERRSWQFLQAEIPDLALSGKQSGYRNDSLHLCGTLEEFIRVFNIASEHLVEALRQSAHLASPRRHFFATEVPTYGIYAPPNSFPTDTALSQWAFAHTLAAPLTLPHSPRVLLCLDACQRAHEQLKQEGASDPDRVELAVLFQRCVLVHEHFHAILEVGLDHHRTPALGTHAVEAWRAAAGVNEALAVWMELHFARVIHRPDLMELVLSYIQAGSYPDWPYRGAEYLENLYQQRGLEPVRQLIRSLRQTPEMAQTQFNALQ